MIGDFERKTKKTKERRRVAENSDKHPKTLPKDPQMLLIFIFTSLKASYFVLWDESQTTIISSCRIAEFKGFRLTIWLDIE
jgi:hypothetical protein